MSPVPETDPRLARVLRRYGRHALTDPVALRAAARDCGGFTPGELDALTAVAGGPALAALADREGGAEPAAIDAAATGLDAPAGIPAERMRWALGALAVAANPVHGDQQETGAQAEATGPPLGRDHRVHWEDAPPPTAALTRPAPRRRRTALILALVVLLLAAGGVGAYLLLRDEDTAAPPPDRYAPEQVAQRYRALGAQLLDGAFRCTQSPARPGELERVGCDVTGYRLTLITYDTPARLPESRRREVPESDQGNNVVRTARTSQAGAGFAMAELASGKSTVYWDVDSPRPVSATVTAERTPLPVLAGFYDARQFGVLRRPEVPGPAFSSGVLWDFARTQVAGEPSARCVSVPVESGTTETVKCPLDDGSMLVFSLAANRDTLNRLRVENSGEGGVVPGSVDVSTWKRAGQPTQGQFISFVTADDRSPTIYFDDDRTLAYGYFFGAPGSAPATLLDRWRRGLG